MNTKKTLAAVAAAALAAGLLLGGWLRHGPHGEEASHEHGEAAHEHAPGEEHDDASTVLLDDQQIRQAGITLETVAAARLSARLVLPGEVHADAERTVQVVARRAGVAEAVPGQPGARVAKGQLLAQLSSPELAGERAELLAAQQRLAQARADHAREKQLFDDRISARQDFLQAQAALQAAEIAERSARQKLAGLGTDAGGTLTRLAVPSPIAGTVIDKRVAAGQVVAAGELLFVVSDLQSVWVEAPVPAQELARVAPGRAVRIAAGGLRADASVSHLSPVLSDRSRTALLRVVLPNREGRWRPGLPVQVAVAGEEADVPVAVRAQALQTVDGQEVVFVRAGPGFEPRAVRTGLRDGDLVEIRSGLKAGERYAAANSHVVKAELGKAGAAHEH